MKREYDVFISFKNSDNGKKTDDRVLGQELYEYLEAKGLKPFFSAITLEKNGIDKWDDEIDRALKSAKIFIAIGSSKSYLTSNWVQKERTIYLTLKSLDTSKALFIYMLPPMQLKDLPHELAGFQCFQDREVDKFEHLYNSIINHIKGIDLEEEKKESSNGGININGDVNGIGVVTGGNVTQTINNKTINTENYIENIDNKDGGIINFN